MTPRLVYKKKQTWLEKIKNYKKTTVILCNKKSIAEAKK